MPLSQPVAVPEASATDASETPFADGGVGLRPGDLEVVAERGVRLGQQPPDLAVGIRTVRGAEQRGDPQDPLVVRDDVAGPPPQHGIG